jgi:hypothetical protein
MVEILSFAFFQAFCSTIHVANTQFISGFALKVLKSAGPEKTATKSDRSPARLAT